MQCLQSMLNKFTVVIQLASLSQKADIKSNSKLLQSTLQPTFQWWCIILNSWWEDCVKSW